MRRALLLSALAALLLSILASAVAAETAPGDLMDRIRAAGDLETYPNANAIVIQDLIDAVFEKSGAMVVRNHGIVKILTEAGKKAHAEKPFPYFRLYGEVRIELARVIKPDGTILVVPEDQITDITDPQVVAMNIYEPDIRQKRVHFPGLEVGDVIEYVAVSDYPRPYFEGNFDLVVLFESTEPRILTRVVCNGPADMPLRYVVKQGTRVIDEDLGYYAREEDDRRIYSWEAENVAQILPEPGMPNVMEIGRKLVCGTSRDWVQVSRWYHDMTESMIEMSDEMKAEVADITEGMSEDEQKMRALYYWVQSNVRYMGLAIGKKAGFQPHPVTMTYEKRYGVCKDKAALLVAFLREAGLNSHIVLCNPTFNVDEEVPNVSFNHAIVAVEEDDGEYVFMDPTVENAMDLLVPLEAEQNVLVCTEEGEPLMQTDYSPPEKSLGFMEAQSVVHEDGTLESTVHFTTSGFYDVAFRNFGRLVPEARQKQIWTSVIQRIYPGAVLTEYETSDPENLYEAFGIKVSFRIQDYALLADEYMLVKLPMASGQLRLLSQSFFSNASLPERTYALDMMSTFQALDKETITFPAGYEIKSVPDDIDMDGNQVSYTMSYQPAGVSIEEPEGAVAVEYTKDLKVKSKKISPEEYPNLKKILKIADKSNRGEVILVRKDGEG